MLYTQQEIEIRKDPTGNDYAYTQMFARKENAHTYTSMYSQNTRTHASMHKLQKAQRPLKKQISISTHEHARKHAHVMNYLLINNRHACEVTQQTRCAHDIDTCHVDWIVSNIKNQISSKCSAAYRLKSHF